MKTFLTHFFAALLSVSVLSSLTVPVKAAGDDAQKRELRHAFLGFYMSVGPARAATDPAEVVKAGASAWHLPDEKARKSLNDFGSWLLAAKPTDIAVEEVKTAGDLARMTIQFAHVKEPHPSRAEVTLVRSAPAGDRSWKIVRFDLEENAPATAPHLSMKSVATIGHGAQETLESYLNFLASLSANPAGQSTAVDPQAFANSMAKWWVDKQDRSQTRAMTQGAMFFRLYQPTKWTIETVGSASPTAETFSVTVQPGNEVSRRLGPKTLTFGLVLSDTTTGWKISSYTNPQLAPTK